MKNNNKTAYNFLFNRRREIIICILLIAASLVVYWQITNHGFINYDDGNYVTENSHVQAGLTFESIKWAFTTCHASNWHPLTWLSHMLDYELYGLNPMGHHWTSLQIHLINTLLLFFILQYMTGALWKSAIVAALFALHPLHVESVAWVSERKDVLSAFFGMLTISAYIMYVKKRNLLRYSLVFIFLSLGLMAKPMLVTLPFVLLLLDFWPLKRLKLTLNQASGQTSNLLLLIREKTPLIAPVAISAILTLIAQHSSALKTLESFPLQTRVANAFISYLSYFGKAIWPLGLSVFYPHPGDSISLWYASGAALMIAVSLFIAVNTSKKYPYIITGLLWFFITLLPVVGIIQVGYQAMADRYTYIPLIGIFIILAWGGSDLLKKWTNKKIVSSILAMSVLLVLTMQSFHQAAHWKNSSTLFENAIKVTENNWLAHNNLGVALLGKRELDKAIYHYKKALNIKPDTLGAIKNLGFALSEKGSFKEAAQYFTKAIVINPEDFDAHYKLGCILAKQEKFNEAIRPFAETIRINPDYAPAYYEIGIILAMKGKLQKSKEFFLKAIQLKPDYKEARNNLLILEQMTQQDEKQR
ncbi:MAG: tetratricopeptide repeat protein [Desulfobacteraceae bacterium]|nr:tetratricopeptide repeat protein [Desulfobacteraceae bacterium]